MEDGRWKLVDDKSLSPERACVLSSSLRHPDHRARGPSINIRRSGENSMPVSKKAAAMAVGIVVAVSAATLGQDRGGSPRPSASNAETIVMAGNINWIDISDVSALKAGVIKSIELEVGDEVEEGKEIGLLHDEIARLTMAKAEIA